VSSTIPKTPTKDATKMASPVARWTSFVSPDAAALATTGAMIDGTNEIIQNADWNTWFAAPCAARATVLPMRPTQKTSTAPTNGMMRKLSIAGTKSFMICLSRASFAGIASAQ
jgi:hypothetical protein